jgi:hypothetical protein
MLISVLVLSALFGLQFNEFATSNPIPFPTVLMPEEYINATILRGEYGVIYAEVSALYPFHNIGHESVMMYYPVPPSSDEISVKMNETSLEWSYCDKNYSTVVGDFPMINWTIEPVPDFFEIRTHYCHPIPTNRNLTFLYAMGTGRYLESFAKNTTAYVSLNISKEIAPKEKSIDVYTIGYNETTGEWIWKPANYTITQTNKTWSMSLTEVSKPFHPLEEDLLVTIKPGGSVSGVNDDLELTMSIDKTTIVIGEVVNTTLTLRNIGNDTLTIWFGSSQSFDTYLYYMDIPIARWSDGKCFLLYVWELYLEPNETFSQTLEWNFFLYHPSTGKFSSPYPGNYQIVGVCVGHFLEMWPAVTTGKLPIELILPDINHDMKINWKDLLTLARAYGAKIGEPTYIAEADFDSSGKIDWKDLLILSKNYGKTWQDYWEE